MTWDKKHIYLSAIKIQSKWETVILKKMIIYTYTHTKNVTHIPYVCVVSYEAQTQARVRLLKNYNMKRPIQQRYNTGTT